MKLAIVNFTRDHSPRSEREGDGEEEAADVS